MTERDVAAAVERLRKRPWLTTADYEDFCAVCDALAGAQQEIAKLRTRVDELDAANAILEQSLEGAGL